MGGLFGGPSGPDPAELRREEEKEQRKALASDRNAARRAAARRGVSSLSTGLVIPGQNNTGGGG